MARMKPETDFLPEAKALLPGAEVLHVKAAFSGKPIRNWLAEWDALADAKGLDAKAIRAEDKVKGSPYYDRIMDAVKPLLARKPASISFLWMQGESDAKRGTEGVYEEALTALIAKLRRDLAAPKMNVVIARISDHGTKNAKGQSFPGWEVVRQAQENVVANDPRAALVNVDDCNGPKDGLHYPREGYTLMGQRMAREAVALIKRGESAAASTRQPIAPSPDGPVLRIAFFTPSDVEPPENVRERIGETVAYAQDFFSKWMKHWGYPVENPLLVKRDANGLPEVMFVKGEHSYDSGRYEKPDFQQEVIQKASKEHGIPRQGQVWWIFIYKAAEKGWGRGGGNAFAGGACTVYFHTHPGKIEAGDDLAGGLLRDLCLKAVIHELGHALGLPHIGPLDKDELGNSLMGPINRVYAERKDPDDTRVYLTRAAATILWKHPLFGSPPPARRRLPNLRLSPVEGKVAEDGGTVSVSGTVSHGGDLHSAIVAFQPVRSHPGGYWRKTFVGKVDQQGRFQVELNEMPNGRGELQIAFCSNDGPVVGAEGRIGFDAGFAAAYELSDETLSLEAPAPRPQQRRRADPPGGGPRAGQRRAHEPR